MAQPVSGRRGRLSIALLLFLIALGARLVGINHGLPHFGEPDAYIVSQADTMIEDGITDRHRAGWKYPHLVATIVALCPPERVERLGPGATLEEHRELATRLRKRTRVVVATVSSLAAPASYLIAARFLAGRFAFLAGLLVASSLLHVCFSVQARPHGPVSAFATLALLCAIRWREKPSTGRALVLGLGLAASIGTLHSGAAALAPTGAALVGLFFRSTAPRAKVLVGTLLVFMMVSASAGWFYIRAEDGYGMNPNRSSGAIAKREGGLGDVKLDKLAKTGRSLDNVYKDQIVFVFSDHVVPLSLFNGHGFVVAYNTLINYDPLILFFAVVGLLALMALGLRRRPKRGDVTGAQREAASAAWITVLYGAPALLVYGLYENSTDRFYLALVPVTCILAAFGMSWLWTRKVFQFAARGIVGAGLLATVLAAGSAAHLRLAPDTYTLAADAVVELSGERDPLVYMVEIIGLPLMMQGDMFQRDAIWSRGPWDRYQWEILHKKKRKLVGEDRGPVLARSAPAGEAAKRLGRRLMPATISTRMRVFHSDDKATEAALALAQVDADIVLMSTSRAIANDFVGPVAIRDAWKAAVRADGRWDLARTIKSSRLSDHRPLGYKLGFLDVFTNTARGSEIEIWTRHDS